MSENERADTAAHENRQTAGRRLYIVQTAFANEIRPSRVIGCYLDEGKGRTTISDGFPGDWTVRLMVPDWPVDPVEIQFPMYEWKIENQVIGLVGMWRRNEDYKNER